MATPITLKIYRGNELVRTEQFNREIVKIGRLASAHLVLDEEGIARIHAVIEVAPSGAREQAPPALYREGQRLVRARRGLSAHR